MGQRIKYAFLTFCLFSVLAQANANIETLSEESPVAASSGVSRDELAAYATAHARVTLADYLDLSRPGTANDEKLKRLLEKAQNAWLSNSNEQARLHFLAIANLSLEADWREAQREAIHYAHLRLAQIAETPTEREEWLQKAARFFPDIDVDATLFPPPLVRDFRTARQRASATAKLVEPIKLFPEYRYVLLNGKRFEITPDLKMPIPEGTHRLTVFSDTHPPVTEKFSTSQMELLPLNSRPIAQGKCDAPEVAILPTGITTDLVVLFQKGCSRSLTSTGWKSEKNLTPNFKLQPVPLENSQLDAQIANPFGDPSEKLAKNQNRAWIWVGVSALLVGAVYVVQEQMNQSSKSVEPVHRNGF